MKYNITATATFGLESVVALELEKLGITERRIENGKVTFQGDERDIVKCNLWLRTADRVLIEVDSFKAETFEELFQGTLKQNWGDIIPENGMMHITGKSVKSKLFSVPDCQGIVKKAVVESMKKKYNRNWFEEDGPVYKIEIGLLKDIATLTIDTSGPGLHKRGYRELAGEAPLKETLAAAMVLLSRWDNTRLMADLFCGSGTILIEAALIGRNMAPGLNRSFVSETWPQIPSSLWKEEIEAARAAVNDSDFRILGSDISGKILATARENARKAGVEENIAFQKLDFREFSSKKRYGVLISNPPYGERIGEAKEVVNIYKDMASLFERLKDWSYFVITSHPEFQKLVGRKADKNRKLYNGRIQCYYYEYFGALPPKSRNSYLNELDKESEE